LDNPAALDVQTRDNALGQHTIPRYLTSPPRGGTAADEERSTAKETPPPLYGLRPARPTAFMLWTRANERFIFRGLYRFETSRQARFARSPTYGCLRLRKFARPPRPHPRPTQPSRTTLPTHRPARRRLCRHPLRRTLLRRYRPMGAQPGHRPDAPPRLHPH